MVKAEKSGSFQNFMKVETIIETTFIEVTPGYYAYKQNIGVLSVKDNQNPNASEKIIQGLCDAAGLKNLMKNNEKPLFSDIKKRNGCDTFLELVTDEMLEEIKIYGVSAYLANDRSKGLVNDPKWFDYFQEGGSIANVVRFRSYDHSFYTLTGETMTTGIRFDYIDARMRSGVYDLDKVAEILKQRDDITFVFEGSRSYDETDPAKPYLIPYYNNDSGKETMLAFFFTPTAEQANLIQKEYEKNEKNGRNRVQVILEHDMLGIACAKYEEEIEFSSDEEDDSFG